MSFDSFKSIAEVLTEYQITSTSDRFLASLEFPIPDSFRNDLAFYQAELTFDESESAVCEMILFPILSTVCQLFKITWTHLSRLSPWPNVVIPFTVKQFAFN